MEMTIDEANETLSLIYSNYRIVGDRLAVFKDDIGNLGYMLLSNGDIVDAKYKSLFARPYYVISGRFERGYYDKTSRLIENAKISFIESETKLDLEFINKTIKIIETPNIDYKILGILISNKLNKGDLEVYNSVTGNLICEVPAEKLDYVKNWGFSKHIPFAIKLDDSIIGVTEDGQFGDIETLLRNKGYNPKVIKRCKSIKYEIQDERDKVYTLNQFGQLY